MGSTQSVPKEKEKSGSFVIKSTFIKRIGSAFLAPGLVQDGNGQRSGRLDNGTFSS